MTQICFIGIDIGTSTCKTIALDPAGQIIARATHDYPLLMPQPGWAEQDPELWWQAARETLRKVVADLGSGHQIRAIGLTGQMHGLVPLDPQDRIIRPALLWCDQRAAAQCDRLTEQLGGLEKLLQLTANRMLPGFTGGKFLWLAEHEPETFARMRRFLNPKDYIRLKLTGIHSTDVSDASGTGLFDVRNRRWSSDLLEVVGLTQDMVPPAAESHEVTGEVARQVAEDLGLPLGVPVIAGGGDAVLQTISQGIQEPGLVGITIGTAGVLGAVSRDCPDNPGGRVQVSCGNAPGLWHVMGVTISAGGALQWLRDALTPLASGLSFDRLVELAETTPPGGDGLLFLPYLLGERCPEVAPDARGALIGLTRAHQIGHISRAVMEGVALNLRSILDLYRQAGLPCDLLRASGGATRSPFWMQLIADVSGRPVAKVSGASEGGAFGAALLAGVGSKDWSGLDQALSIVRETEVSQPRMERTRIYDCLHAIHKTLCGTLDGVFSAVAASQSEPGIGMPERTL